MRAPAPATNVSVSFLMSISSDRKSRTKSNASIEMAFQQRSALIVTFDETLEPTAAMRRRNCAQRAGNQWNSTRNAGARNDSPGESLFMRWRNLSPHKIDSMPTKGPNMRVAEVMTRSVFIVNPDETIQEAAMAM